MKGALVQMVFELRALHDLHAQPPFVPVVFLTDEEIGSHDSGRHIRRLAAGAKRAFVLELVGDWTSVGEDLRMHTLTPSGLLGRITSATTPPLPYTNVIYSGHVWRDRKLGMSHFSPRVACAALDAPVVLIIGTSVECGKTSAAKWVVRRLKAHGLRVAGVKLTGAGHVRDILAMRCVARSGPCEPLDCDARGAAGIRLRAAGSNAHDRSAGGRRRREQLCAARPGRHSPGTRHFTRSGEHCEICMRAARICTFQVCLTSTLEGVCDGAERRRRWQFLPRIEQSPRGPCGPHGCSPWPRR
jgi:hypothetical protein